MPDDFAALDDPVGRSLNGRHAHLARRAGKTATYQTGVSTFATVPAEPTSADWDDLAHLLGRGGLADLFTAPTTPPADWRNVFDMAGFQMVLSRPTWTSAAQDVATDRGAVNTTDRETDGTSDRGAGPTTHRPNRETDGTTDRTTDGEAEPRADRRADPTLDRGADFAVADLGRADVPDMLALIAATRPGPAPARRARAPAGTGRRR